MDFGSGIVDDSGTAGRSPLGKPAQPVGSQSPWLGVNALTEFIFCSRAGLLEYERQKVDTGDEQQRTPRLDYLPDYEAEVIREKLASLGRQLQGAGVFIGLLLAAIFVVAYFDRITAILIGVGGLVGAPWLYRQTRLYLWLYGEWRQVNKAKKHEPDLNLTVVQQMNWWDLRKAGFESVEPREGFRDSGLRITGRPFRLLRRGAVCIPVFRTSQEDRRLYRQHYARLAAYAHLIETCEGAQVPFGIVLFAQSYEADVVPITAEAIKTFEQGLADARRVLFQSHSERSNPSRPSDESICHGCHLGRPRFYSPGNSELTLGETVIKPFRTKSSLNDHDYHSDCGDRYGWVPAHKLAISEGLTD